MKAYIRITKQIGSVYLIEIFNFILMFLLFVVLTRYLTQYQFGIYSLLNVTILFLVGLLPLGLTDFIIRDLAGKKESIKKRRFSQVFTFLSLTTFISIILILVIGFFVLNYLNYQAIFLPITLAVLCSGIIVLGTLIAYYAYVKKQAAATKFINVSLKSMWALPVLLLPFIYKLTLNNIFLTKLLFTTTAFACIIVYYKKNKLKFFNKINKEYIKKALLFSLPLSTLVVSQWIITASDRYILGLFHSAVLVGKYSYIYSLLNFILLFSASSITMTIYPHVVENHNKGNKKKSNFLLNASLKYVLVLLLPALTGLFFLSKEIITMVSGTKYLSAVPIIPILMFFPLVAGVNIIWIKSLLLQNKTKTIAIVYMGGMVLNIILNFLLIPKFHYFGAAIATSITYIVLCIHFFIKSKKHIRLDYKYLKLPRIMLSTIIMALAIGFIHPQNIFTKLATIGFGAIIYFLSLYLTKAYVKEEEAFIRLFFPTKAKRRKSWEYLLP